MLALEELKTVSVQLCLALQIKNFWSKLAVGMNQCHLSCLLSPQISNTSELSINYSLNLDSLSQLRHSRAQVLPRFLPPFDELAETQLHVLGRPLGTGGVIQIF